MPDNRGKREQERSPGKGMGCSSSDNIIRGIFLRFSFLLVYHLVDFFLVLLSVAYVSANAVFFFLLCLLFTVSFFDIQKCDSRMSGHVRAFWSGVPPPCTAAKLRDRIKISLKVLSATRLWILYYVRVRAPVLMATLRLPFFVKWLSAGNILDTRF